MDNQELIEALRNCNKGLGEPLTKKQKDLIRDGIQNHAENTKSYNTDRLVEGANIFFKNHLVDWLKVD